MRVWLVLAMVLACGSAPTSVYLAQPPIIATTSSSVTPLPAGVQLDVDVDAEGHLSATGFPAVSVDGRIAVSVHELDDGMRGYPHVVMRVFDAASGGSARREMPIVDISDTEERPEGDCTFLLKRARTRLVAVRAFLRDASWVTLDESGLTATLADHELTVLDAHTGRTLHTRNYPAIDSDECAFEPSDAKSYGDAQRRWLLVQVSYASGPDWCNMDDDVALVVLRSTP
jgi:hypothetical protein